MNISFAEREDFHLLNFLDIHISEKELMKSISDKRR